MIGIEDIEGIKGYVRVAFLDTSDATDDAPSNSLRARSSNSIIEIGACRGALGLVDVALSGGFDFLPRPPPPVAWMLFCQSGCC